MFLALNGAELVAGDEDRYVTTLVLAEESLSEADFAAWLRVRLQRPAVARVHEPAARYR